MSDVSKVAKPLSQVFIEMLKRMLDWKGLAEFVDQFPDSHMAILALVVVLGFPTIAFLIAIALICRTISDCYRTQTQTEIELAKIGIAKAEPRRLLLKAAIWIFILVFLGLSFAALWPTPT